MGEWRSSGPTTSSRPRVVATARCSISRRSASPLAKPTKARRRGSSMSSLDGKAVAVDDELPPALSSMWRLCKLGYQHEPALMLVAFVLSLLAALPDALLAVWFKVLGE